MNICIICFHLWPIPPIRGGAINIVTFELSKELARRGHHVTTFSIRDPLLPNYEESEGIRYFRFRVLPTPSVPWAFRERGFWIPKKLLYCFSTLMKTLEIQSEVSIIQCFDPLVVLSHTVSKTLLKKHVVASVHYPSKGWRLLRLADRVTTVSQFMKKRISIDNGIPEEEIEVIYNGVSTEEFNPRIDGSEIRDRYGLGESPLILFVGRVTPIKGVDCLLKSVPLIAKRIPDVRVLIVGPFAPGEPPAEKERYKDRINDLVRRLKLDNVTFTGPVDVFKELPKIYAACDVFTCPSIVDEVFPLVCEEAMASGKPVVATRSGGIPEIVKDGEVGYIVPKGDEKQLAKALTTILEDHSLQKRMGNAARKRVEAEFSWDIIAEKYLKLYQELIKYKRM